MTQEEMIESLRKRADKVGEFRTTRLVFSGLCLGCGVEDLLTFCVENYFDELENKMEVRRLIQTVVKRVEAGESLQNPAISGGL